MAEKSDNKIIRFLVPNEITCSEPSNTTDGHSRNYVYYKYEFDFQFEACVDFNEECAEYERKRSKQITESHIECYVVDGLDRHRKCMFAQDLTFFSLPLSYF